MYEIAAERHFDAAHALRGYRGKCETTHGHRFKVVARLAAANLDDIGIAYDFTELKKHLDDILAGLDHTNLNEVPPFDRINPSSENLAATIYGKLAQRLPPDAVTLRAVEVWESPEQWVSYTP